jgi:hypothetical protein
LWLSEITHGDRATVRRQIDDEGPLLLLPTRFGQALLRVLEVASALV